MSGLVKALLITVTSAILSPAVPGVNVTVNVQLLPGTSIPAPSGHGVAPEGPITKSLAFAPPIVMLVILNVAVPLLVSVTVCGALLLPTD